MSEGLLLSILNLFKTLLNFAGTFAGPPFNPNISSVVSRKVQPVTSCSQIKISVTVASSDLTVVMIGPQI
ncbi:unnamed protein product [Rhizophagus irregularis]|uniref:Uncharacterized protein n=1 Tax=Rhizophagus irregularis TaxID=588596 RepID=A0A915ZED6_9GLOM|nr:unnamed protein product [Rhizophagus irregularis]